MMIPEEESLGVFSEIKDDEMDYGAALLGLKCVRNV
jgi:hypothetical protein